MAKAKALSVEEHQRILQLRKDGVSVSAIAKQVERSTYCIYRVLKKNNEEQAPPLQQEAPKKKQKVAKAPPATFNPAPQLLEGPTDSSAALLCAVESVEVSPYKPIPMPPSVRSSERQQPPSRAQGVRPGSVNASVSFSNTPVDKSVAKPQNEDTAEFWLSPDPLEPTTTQTAPVTESGVGRKRVQPQQLSKKPQQPTKKTVNSGVSKQATQPSSALVVNLSRVPVTNKRGSSNTGVDGLLNRIQDEIQRLEGLSQSDGYDAQLLQMLVKFRAEILLVQLQKMHANAQEGSAEEKETNQLLHEKLVKEIALLNVQADREKLELEREQIRYKMTTMVCRKRLLDANASPTDIDQLFPRQ
ncbi:unnamed protein product [Phytophthora lilii]|uniref:Unnamed protein product n=1 Tax=Phytophthora lilii TaxID=2077276 RepID=A0A9W6WRD3_9STRA|nr:unnamed protein product [Phytophthora lilii]